jgi:16S rRNA processing protein RimM
VEDLLLVGKVIRPHGLAGYLRIWSYAESEKSFLNAGTVFLRCDSGEVHDFRIVSVRPHKNIYLMKLKNLAASDDAEKYRGAEILIRKDSVEREDEDDYFWHELLGLQVYLNTGRHIGTISQILQTGSNDVYVVREGEREYLIPGIYDVVEEIDLSGGKMIIAEIEGMLDLNEV